MANEIPIDQLERIVGKENLKVELQGVFISPENSSAVSEVVKLANQQKFRLLPSGSGSILDPSKFTAENVVALAEVDAAISDSLFTHQITSPSRRNVLIFDSQSFPWVSPTDSISPIM